MVEGFVPLSKTIKYWPSLLGEADFLDDIGLINYSVESTDDSFRISGELVYFRDLSFGFSEIEDFEIKVASSGSITKLDFVAQIFPKVIIQLPDISFSFVFENSLIHAMEFDGSNWIRKTDTSNEELPVEIVIQGVGIRYDTENNLDIDLFSNSSISIDPIEIGNSGIIISLNGIIPYFSGINQPPIPAPPGFKGVYIDDATLIFPTFWSHDDNNSTGVIKGRNLLVGTGGITGLLSLEAKSGSNPNPLVEARFGSGFYVSINSFELELNQSSIIQSSILGLMKVPGFKDAQGNDAEINVSVNIGDDFFSVTVSNDIGLNLISVPGVFDLRMDSLAMGRLDDRFYLNVSGGINFKNQGGTIGKIIDGEIAIQNLIIWDNGEIELKGGKVVLPEAISCKIGPAELSVTAIGLGSYEQQYDGQLRKYKFFKFDGGISLNPGGVDASGDGVTFYYTVDNDPGSNKHPHSFVRIQGIKVEIVIPGNATPETAALIIEGFLAMRNPDPGNPEPNAGTEYVGGISFYVPKTGFAASAAMRLNPKIPSFVVDAHVEFNSPTPLGPTGLGIYGFRGLIGKRYVIDKEAVPGLTQESEWWEYYKAKVPEKYSEGVWPGKLSSKDGFSLGAGISLATTLDSGKAFSSKVFFMLSLPEILLIQGQAQILKDRIKLIDTDDPPFYAMIAITKESVEADFGTKFNIPDDKRPGSIAKVDGLSELGFFFKDASAWYVNIGRDLPENRRIKVRLLELFDAYFYLMLSANGIRTGAGATFDFEKEFGPLRAELHAYLDLAAKVQFKPKQLGGSIRFGGSVGLYIFKFGFNLSVAASLAAESPKPFIVTGSLEACIRVLKKDRCAKFNFTWVKDATLDTSEVGILDPDSASMAKNMLTHETYDLYYSAGFPSAGDLTSIATHVVPLDSYIDIEFKKGVLPDDTQVKPKFGGNTQGAKYVEFMAPQKGKSPRVKHVFYLDDINIKIWDGSAWVDYDIYDASMPLNSAPFVTTDLSTLKYGYWQYQTPKLHNKLRILAQSPISFLTPGSGNTSLERLGIGYEDIFCDPDELQKTCVNFDMDRIKKDIGIKINANINRFLKKVLFRVINVDGYIVDNPYSTFTNALAIPDETAIELIFPETMGFIALNLQSECSDITIAYYKRSESGTDSSGQPVFTYSVIDSAQYDQTDMQNPIVYNDAEDPVDKVVITSGVAAGPLSNICDMDTSLQADALELFISTLASNGHLTNPSFNMYPTAPYATTYSTAFLDSDLYGPVVSSAQVDYNHVEWDNDQGYLEFQITDNYGYACGVRLEVQGAGSVAFDDIIGFQNLIIDTPNLTNGENTSFQIDAILSNESVVRLNGNGCYNIIHCHNNLSTFLYEICTISEEDLIFNNTLPTLADVQNETDTLADGINGSVKPVWRPNSYFAIEVKTKERLFKDGSSSDLVMPYTHSHVFSFKTAGQVGHFHELRPEYMALETVDREDEFKLATLKHYIDFSRCYPNADGRLTNAKPLFYNDPDLRVFYVDNYVYSFFRDWATYNGINATSADLEVTIKDPAPEVSVPEPTPTSGEWKSNNGVGADPFYEPMVPKETTILNNLITNGSPCADVDPLDTVGVYNSFNGFGPLKPLKLYTAIFNSKYKDNASNPDYEVVEIHRYVFQTSRYADFTEQVDSYQFMDEDGVTVLSEAVYNVDRDFSGANLSKASSIILDTLPETDQLVSDFMLPLDRLLDGVLKLGALEPAVGTEFNIIRDTSNNNTILGILIRNPEPFNDPKTPATDLEDALYLEIDSGPRANNAVIYSKDLKSAFITNSDGSLDLGTGSFEFTFKYKLFNGTNYAAVTTETVQIQIS